MNRAIGLFFLLQTLFTVAPQADAPSASQHSSVSSITATVDPTKTWNTWDGWGSSLAWWARAIGGTRNANIYADLIYTTGDISVAEEKYPGLGFNIARYNVGGGGIRQPLERKSPRMPWFRDIHGYWTNPGSPATDSSGWNWATDANQRSMMLMARDRGANLFEMFSDSPMWWMNKNHSTSGSDGGRDCLNPAYSKHFAKYLSTVASYARDHWNIHFSSVEAFNEPSPGWWKYPGRQEGCHFDLGTQRTSLAALHSAMHTAGLDEVLLAASDENSVDDALSTWNNLDDRTRLRIGRVNVHGYFAGTEPYRGAKRQLLSTAARGASKPLWMSEYGDGDASGLTLAHSILLDVRGLHPKAWVYWQPVEPEGSGWGLINANYVDTDDQANGEMTTPFVRVNRKFFVLGQFTRYIRQGFQIIDIDDPDSIAAYDAQAARLVIVTLNGGMPKRVEYDLSRFARIGSKFTRIATTIAPGHDVPDWKLSSDGPCTINDLDKKRFWSVFYPNTIQTFMIDDVYR
jgi:galactan endo-1,6-beta-galactosidase